MYRGFNLKFEPTKQYIDKYKNIGLSIYDKDRAIIEKAIESFKISEDKIDGSKLQASWFPTVQAHVFISHSHEDKDSTALTLAGWLYDTFGIKSFIDSCLWGYANDLLRLIDNTYCRSVDNKISYDYNKRNYSTSHIHMMLSTALTTMIDNTECLFFLNTPRSIIPNTEIEKTLSPWIYSEIVTSKLIQKKNVRDHRISERIYSHSSQNLNEGGFPKLKVEYDVDLSHLTDIDLTSLNNWLNNANKKRPEVALDIFYDLYP